MLAEIETEDGWLNTIIDIASDEPEKKEALKVIGQNPAAWGDMKVQDLYAYFINTSSDNTSIKECLDSYDKKSPAE